MAELILRVAALYFASGLLFAIAFVIRGAGQMDHSARGTPFGFRLLIFPGACALWPLLLAKWIQSHDGGQAE